MDQRTLDILDSLDEIASLLKHTFVAKDELAELLVTCAIAQEHLLIVGPPGTGKSELIKRFALLCSGGDTGSGERVPYFEYLLTRFTEPNEIFGAVNVAAFSEGQGVWRDTRNMLPRAEIAFLDEVFKANSAILNALLTLLNERTFYNGPRPEQTHLIFAVGATNEVPDDRELDALYDRFPIRVWTDNVEEPLFGDLMARGWDLEKGRIAQGHGLRLNPITTTGALRELHRTLARVDVGPVAREYREAVRRIRAEGIQLSDRRVVKLLKLLAASALRHRREAVNPGDFWVLRHVWHDPEQLPHLETIVDPYVEQYQGESWGGERGLDQADDDLERLRSDLPRLRTDADFADNLQQAEALRLELIHHKAGAASASAEERRRRDELLASLDAHVDAILRRMQAQE
jgi:MoxR-like ATPase